MRKTHLSLMTLLTVAMAGGAFAAPAPPAAAAPRSDPCLSVDASGFPRFGCATTFNLRLMVADPRDLQRGSAMAPAAGDPALAAVERYRSGQVKPLSVRVVPQSGAAAPAAESGGETQ